MKHLSATTMVLFALLLSFGASGTVHIVSNTLNTGEGSLRQSIADAEAGDTVLIDIKGDIALESTIDLSGHGELTIIGSYPKHTTISPTESCTGELFLIDDAGPIRFEAIGFEGGNGEIRHITISNSPLPKGVEIVRCRFQNNNMTAADKNGAAVSVDGSFALIQSCSIIDNEADRAVIYGAGSSEIEIINTTISGNIASDKAAGIYTAGSTTVQLFYSTIIYNEADAGPEAICAAGNSEIRLENNAIGYNGSGQQMEEEDAGEIISIGGNVIRQNYLLEGTGIDLFLITDLLDPIIDFGLRANIKEDGFGLKYWPIVSSSSPLMNTQEPTVNTPIRDGRLAPRSLQGSYFSSEPDAGAIEYTHLRVTNDDGNPGTANSFLWTLDPLQQKDLVHYIEFDIPGTPSAIDIETIANVTGEKYIIDGFSQEGSSIPGPHQEEIPGLTRGDIQIRIVNDGSLLEGIEFNSGSEGSIIRGLSVQGFGYHGMDINASDIIMLGNEIGIDDAGSENGNGRAGVRVDQDNTIIGGRWHWQRNVISGNGTDFSGVGNINLANGGSCRIVGNIIGGSPDGQGSIGAGTSSPTGILIYTRNNMIGAKHHNSSNIIIDNEHGIYLELTGDTTTILNNKIGMAYDGSTAIGNIATGIFIRGADQNLIGDIDATFGNIIAHNGTGIALVTNSTPAEGNRILGNLIFSNTEQGIDFENDDVVFPNDGLMGLTHQNDGIDHPVLNELSNCDDGNSKVSFTLRVPIGENYRVEFFSNESPDPTNGEGQYFVSAHLIMPPSNPATVTVDLGETIDPTHTLSATITQLSSGNTSEFGTNITPDIIEPPVITYSDQCPSVTSVLPESIEGIGGTFDFLTGAPGAETIDAGTGEVFDVTEGTSYEIQYTLSGLCTLSDTGYFSIINVPEEFTMDDICATIPNGTPVPTGPVGTFDFGIPDPGPDVIIDEATGEITGAVEGETYPVVHELTVDGCTAYDTVMVGTYTVDEAFNYTDPICGGETELPISVATPGGTFSFDADPEDGASIDPSSGALTSVFEGAASYSVKYVVTNDQGCSDSSTFLIENLSLNASMIYADICPDVTSLGPEDFEPGGTFSFYPEPFDPEVEIDEAEGFIVHPKEDSVYNVVYAIEESGCTAYDTVEVSVLTVNEGFSFPDFCWDTESPAPLAFGEDGESSYSFLTDPGDGAVMDAASGVITNPVEMTTYTVVHEFTTDIGCSQSDTLEVEALGIDESFLFEDFCPGEESPTPIAAEDGGTFYLLGDVFGGTSIDPGSGVISTPYEDSTYTVQYVITFGIGCSQESTEEVSVISVDESFSFADFCTEFDSGIPVPATEGGAFALAPDPDDGVIINTETGVLTNAAPGTTYYVEYTVGECAEVDTVAVLSKPTDTASFTLENHCTNTPVPPEITGVEGGLFDFSPAPTDDAIIDPTTGLITASEGGSYTIRYITEGTATTCGDTSTANVTLFETPEILDFESDQYLFCPNEDYTTVEVNHEGASKIYWRIGDPAAAITDSTFSYLPDTLYVGDNYFYAEPKSMEGCFGEQEALVFTLSDTSEMQAFDDFNICLGSPAELGAAGGVSYQWITAVTLSDDETQFPAAFSLKEETYIVEITNSDGCLVTDSTKVGFRDRSQCAIDVFNAFSPNEDGVNDFWYIENLINFVPNEVYIYTRWGDEVARFENYDNINVYWDGTDQSGRNLPNGTYYYVVISDDPSLNQAAWVQITR